MKKSIELNAQDTEDLMVALGSWIRNARDDADPYFVDTSARMEALLVKLEAL